jgi:hypothetical protein
MLGPLFFVGPLCLDLSARIDMAKCHRVGLGTHTSKRAKTPHPLRDHLLAGGVSCGQCVLVGKHLRLGLTQVPPEVSRCPFPASAVSALVA